MENKVISLFLAATFDKGPNCAAIYEVKIGGGRGGGRGCKIARVSPVVKAFKTFKEDRIYSSVGCDMSGSHMCLMASYHGADYSFKQLQPLIFDTNTKEVLEFPWPKVPKPFPIVMAVRGRGFFVVAGRTQLANSFNILPPCFELLDPPQGWDSYSLPEFRFEKSSPEIVSGYAVIEDCILISVYYIDHRITEFYCYKVGSSMMDWQVVNKEKEVEEEEEEEEEDIYYPLGGKAEYVDGYIYTISPYNNRLVAYHVRFCAEDEDDGIIQSLGVPIFFNRLDFVDLPVELSFFDCCFCHLGGRIFCMMMSGFHVKPSNIQFVSILIVRVSDDMQLSTLYSDLFALDIQNLGPPNLTSLFFDSQRVQIDYKSEWWTRGLGVRSEHFEDLYGDNHHLKVESVDYLLQLLDLQKYSSVFKDEEIDMTSLVHMTDEDLKSIGLPMGPRKKILFVLRSGID